MSESRKVRVGVVGLGMMGQTHLDVYAQRPDVEIVAIADLDPDRRSGRAKAQGNIEGQASGGADLSHARRYADGAELIADADVELVDVCLPTPLHRSYGEMALRAGKHLLVEKPVARSSADAYALARAAEAGDRFAMPAMCMRFWPGWEWLKDAVDAQTYGRLLSVHFRRMASFPGGPFYSDGQQSGGALLDLHIHDSDFVRHLLGSPQHVFTRGYRRVTSEPDHVVTHYLYGDDGPLVTAEGGWACAPGFGFQMQYTANFEDATAVFDLASSPALRLCRNGASEPVVVPEGMGYAREIAYFLDCIKTGQPPSRVTLRDGAASVALVEAERQSLTTGQLVPVPHAAPA